jgi:hypothetical protein
MAKVTTKPTNFQPISITIDLETQEEAEIFFGLFNTASICDLQYSNVKWIDLCRAIRAGQEQYIGKLPAKITEQLRDHCTIRK